MYDLLQGVCWRNTATFPGENSRALCRHTQKKKNKKKDTPWGEHVLCYHGDTDLTKGKTSTFTARDLEFEENIIQRKAREAIEIRDHKPGINRNGGWQLD